MSHSKPFSCGVIDVYCARCIITWRWASDHTGKVAERYVYDPYGRVAKIYNDDWSTEVAWKTASKENAILYCGYRYDNETELYHVRHRYYHPTLGRWISRDPIGYEDGMNLYEYVGSSPVGHVDPSGLVVKWVRGPRRGDCCSEKEEGKCVVRLKDYPNFRRFEFTMRTGLEDITFKLYPKTINKAGTALFNKMVTNVVMRVAIRVIGRQLLKEILSGGNLGPAGRIKALATKDRAKIMVHGASVKGVYGQVAYEKITCGQGWIDWLFDEYYWRGWDDGPALRNEVDVPMSSFLSQSDKTFEWVWSKPAIRLGVKAIQKAKKRYLTLEKDRNARAKAVLREIAKMEKCDADSGLVRAGRRR